MFIFACLYVIMCMLACACYHVHVQVCMFTCPCLHVHVYMCMFAYACLHVHVCMFMFTCACCMYMFTCACCMYMFTCACLHVLVTCPCLLVHIYSSYKNVSNILCLFSYLLQKCNYSLSLRIMILFIIQNFLLYKNFRLITVTSDYIYNGQNCNTNIS